MNIEQALKIINPDTCQEALSMYAGDCDMLLAKAFEASRIVVDTYRAAMQDLTTVAKSSPDYDSTCGLCTGGMSGSCDWQGDMPMDACEQCGKCRCARCVDRSEWEWRGPQEGNT